MPESRQVRTHRAKLQFEEWKSFVPDLGEFMIMYSVSSMKFRLYTEQDWIDIALGNCPEPRYTANDLGEVYDETEKKFTRYRLTKKQRTTSL